MLVPLGQRNWQSRVPILLMNRKSHAGFYSSGWGLLPFSFSLAPAEGIAITQVSDLVERLPEITVESASLSDIAIPRPAAGGGVELLVPVPSSLRIPVSRTTAAKVRFSCLRSDGTSPAQCPIRVYFEADDDRSELVLRTERNATESSVFSFDLEENRAGTIVLEVTAAATMNGADRMAIRNWAVLPPDGLP